MTVYDWNNITVEQLNPKISRRVVHMEGLTVARLEILAGAVVPEHSHIHEQLATVEKGALRFTLEGRDVDLGPGQSLAIPSMVPHSATALEDTVVVDIFSPSRQDWIEGTKNVS